MSSSNPKPFMLKFTLEISNREWPFNKTFTSAVKMQKSLSFSFSGCRQRGGAAVGDGGKLEAAADSNFREEPTSARSCR